MTEKLAQFRDTGAARFFNSFSTSTKAALLYAIPFTIVDAVHYYTAGTALAFSMPVVLVFYLFCGFLAARLAIQNDDGIRELSKIGAAAGMKLWFLSTVINTIISLSVGASSLGVTLVLGIPYLLLCAPVSAAGGALVSGFGSYVYGFVYHRSRIVQDHLVEE